MTTLGNDSGLNSFVSIHDTIYVGSTGRQEAQIRYNGSANAALTFPVGSNSSRAIFADYDGNVYVDDGYANQRVVKWIPSANRSETVMNVSDICHSLFVDVLDNLYCSLGNFHRVLRCPLNGNINSFTIVAGNGTNGSTATLLNNQRGIFVDQALNLYVADCYNSRVQLFQRNERTGITVAGTGATGTISLFRPVGVVLDGNGYLFISDGDGDRIIGSGPHGFRCIINCMSFGSSPIGSILDLPRSVYFDSNGHLIVMSSADYLLFKFLLLKNDCSK